MREKGQKLKTGHKWRSLNHRKKMLIARYLFLLPQTILLILFTLYPIVMSYYYSFFEWARFEPLDQFVGLQHRFLFLEHV